MNLDRATQITYLLLRLVSGFLFIQAGGMKILSWLGGMPPNGGTATPWTQIWIGGILELVGGLLLMLGLFTRPTAFILSGMMAVAYWQFHAPGGTWPAQNGGVPAVIFCFLYLYMAARGGGDYSLDALIQGRRGAAARAGY
jgi:putative oxidoreductase